MKCGKILLSRPFVKERLEKKLAIYRLTLDRSDVSQN